MDFSNFKIRCTYARGVDALSSRDHINVFEILPDQGPVWLDGYFIWQVNPVETEKNRQSNAPNNPITYFCYHLVVIKQRQFANFVFKWICEK